MSSTVFTNGFTEVEANKFNDHDTFVVRFPSSESWACDGVWMTRDRLADLHAQTGEALRAQQQ